MSEARENMAGRTQIRASALVLLFGLAFLACNTGYPMDTWGNPGPGVFPLIAGGALVLLAAWQLAGDVRLILRKEPAERGHDERPAYEGRMTGGWRSPVLMMLLLVAYLLSVTWIGFFVSNFLFIVAASRLVGSRDWGRPVILSLGVDVFCYLLFEVWLKLSFPRGWLF